MKLVFTMNLPYEPPLGGASKGNRRMAEQLAAAGHAVRAVVPCLGVPAQMTMDEWRGALAGQGLTLDEDAAVCRFRANGVDVHAVKDRGVMRRYLIEQIEALDADCVLVSSEEPSQTLLAAALRACPRRVVYVLFTPNFLPFGPRAFFPSERRTRYFDGVGALIATSQFCADYVRRWSELDPVVYYPPVYERGPHPDGDRGASAHVLFVNPCRYKGIDIFVALARALPGIPFAAVPGWGTTREDRERLAALPNVELMSHTRDEQVLFGRARVLLMPSLWLENFPLTITEAMLRGIPVIGSDVGGIPEAMLGAGTVVPVRPIEQFTEQVDENQLAVPVVPDQDVEPWRLALSTLLSAPATYQRASALARERATAFVSGLDIGGLESVLERVARA